MIPSNIIISDLLIPWKNEILIDRSKAILFKCYKFYSNFLIKCFGLPNDLTVLILLTVSLINDPINSSAFFDFVVKVFVILIVIELTITRNGVRANVSKDICQQWKNAKIRVILIVVKFNPITAISPVIKL
jgi:hypothetical protein